MVALPEVCRANGRKSRGPVTEQGKAIASRNSVKHGLLAQRPPILLTEDLETFQGIVQGLVDEYQPQTVTENLLIQQVAMGWLRLHRLWGVEAAIANLAMLQHELTTRYPDILFFDLAALERPSPKSAAEKADLMRLKHEINQATLASLAVPNLEKLDKLAQYERHIIRSLHDAINRLDILRSSQ